QWRHRYRRRLTRRSSERHMADYSLGALPVSASTCSRTAEYSSAETDSEVNSRKRLARLLAMLAPLAVRSLITLGGGSSLAQGLVRFFQWPPSSQDKIGRHLPGV